MTYRHRSPYAVLPDPARPIRLDVSTVRDAYRLGGVSGLGVVLRDLLREAVSGRASTLAEVRLLREWLDETTRSEVVYWSRRLDPDAAPVEVPEDVVGEYVAAEGLTPEEAEGLRSDVASTLARRMAEGGLFRECPVCSGWFAPLRARPATDGLVYCSRPCRRRAGFS